MWRGSPGARQPNGERRWCDESDARSARGKRKKPEHGATGVRDEHGSSSSVFDCRTSGEAYRVGQERYFIFFVNGFAKCQGTW